MIRSETALGQLLAEMSGNPAIALVMAIGYSFGLAEQGVSPFATAEDRRRAQELQHAVAEAVLSGDAEIARLMMRRRSAMIDAWAAARP
jgi:DNA-binding FadR family transcriptional regulator